MISSKEQEFCIQLAKDSLHYYLTNGNYLKYDDAKVIESLGPETMLLNQQGCFVTLTINGQLRGCIGNIIADEPLYLSIIHNAVSAGVKDPRFLSVEIEEYPELFFEVSVMGPVLPLPNIEAIKVGLHGLIVQNGHRQGLLLPQVAAEYDWNTQEFLEHTCQKAGLPINAWHDPDTNIYFFTAEVFGEKDL